MRGSRSTMMMKCLAILATSSIALGALLLPNAHACNSMIRRDLSNNDERVGAGNHLVCSFARRTNRLFLFEIKQSCIANKINHMAPLKKKHSVEKLRRYPIHEQPVITDYFVCWTTLYPTTPRLDPKLSLYRG
jgi:hypothetical protein